MNPAVDHSLIYHNGRTYPEHCARLDSLTGNEWRMVHMPIGHLFSLAIISSLKHALVTVKMGAGDRLKILDGIAEQVYGPVTSAAIAAIDPIDATGREMLREIMKLPREKQTAAFHEGDVFRLLAELNPSLLRALELCQLHEKPGKENTDNV